MILLSSDYSSRLLLFWNSHLIVGEELLLIRLSFGLPQVIIGSQDLKANHAIRQHVDIVSENQKYNKYGILDFCSYGIFLLSSLVHHRGLCTVSE